VPGTHMTRVRQALGPASIEFAAPPEATAWTPPYTDQTTDTRKAVLQITQEVIKEAARTGNAIIVGRGGAYILRDEARALPVFLRGAERPPITAPPPAFPLTHQEATPTDQ